ncbi:peptide deformylase [Candidatus Erwinia haradaeae]|uniref:Peptide deformylase n=1 Tax=Candidatus Erwinia haradaeae TaxID=1922217 RepID=A0A803FTR8_9GAMM|nr:peptide deformylase [Candidatus Erwinia haradaeae]VFP87330.1 Peptide deformylase [Candidatus Erwinia haradaeae]
MSILKILHFPDDRLRYLAKTVQSVNDDTNRIIDDMFDTMYANMGIGLAGTQVNIHQCIIVIDISENRSSPLVLINPKILEKSSQIMTEEGCLSIPDQRARILRFDKVKIRALDRNGQSYELEANNLLSICIQHELDHLIGRLFIDYLSPIKRYRIRQKLEKIYRQNLRV